jgi:hypothetical protein
MLTGSESSCAQYSTSSTNKACLTRAVLTRVANRTTQLTSDRHHLHDASTVPPIHIRIGLEYSTVQYSICPMVVRPIHNLAGHQL